LIYENETYRFTLKVHYVKDASDYAGLTEAQEHHVDIYIKEPLCAVIAHEAVHAANYILSDRGVLCDHDNDEPLAYLVEWVVSKVVDALKRKRVKVV
jgi:hypothetical protein